MSEAEGAEDRRTDTMALLIVEIPWENARSQLDCSQIASTTAARIVHPDCIERAVIAAGANTTAVTRVWIIVCKWTATVEVI